MMITINPCHPGQASLPNDQVMLQAKTARWLPATAGISPARNQPESLKSRDGKLKDG
jgi:hypothetical protein